jgi:hypothetical protein
MVSIDFNELARETIELSETLSQNESERFKLVVNDEVTLSREEVIVESVPEILPELPSFHAVAEAPEVAGVLSYFDCGISTFCLRGMPSDDLGWDYERLEKKDPKFLQEFKLKEDWSFDNFVFYPTRDFCEAEIIAEHILNKRFPREESSLCNISDPGFSWWLDESEHGLEIFYQSQRIERDQDYIQLGPLGDSLIASKRFSMGLTFLSKFFPVNEFSSTEKNFSISCSHNNHEAFLSFQNIFLTGEWNFDHLIEGSVGDEKTFFLFLREVAYLRKFWIYTQSLLEAKK